MKCHSWFTWLIFVVQIFQSKKLSINSNICCVGKTKKKKRKTPTNNLSTFQLDIYLIWHDLEWNLFRFIFEWFDWNCEFHRWGNVTWSFQNDSEWWEIPFFSLVLACFFSSFLYFILLKFNSFDLSCAFECSCVRQKIK